MKMPTLLEQAKDVDFIVKTAIERDPNKRRVKPVEQACVLDFDEESSDDSDFRIEDHPEISDDDADSMDSGGGDNGNKSESVNLDDRNVNCYGFHNTDNESSEDETDDSELDKLDELRNLNSPNANGFSSVGNIIEEARLHSKLNFNEKDAQLLICCGCLGDHSDGVNEIVECDSCGVTVHEACYGISDSNSLASTNSLSPTAPWFCETCRAGVMEPVCELCPNSGGIFKETDVGKWVHLICALYAPGVAFGEVDKLTSVTLFEMPYSKWGAKTCSLCTDDRFARTGVCIGCDAGIAQREGFLSEAHCEEVDQADPFYAHCKLHSDKTLVKKRKRNYLALQLRMQYRKIQFEKEGHMDLPEQIRIQRKLEKQKRHYLEYKRRKLAPWVPTQKMPRLITTSASACRKLLRKAELMGIDTSALEMHDAQITALADIRKKWHIPPAFTVEFIAYYIDRNERLKEMKSTLETLMADNKALLAQQPELRAEYDKLLNKSEEMNVQNTDLKAAIQKYHSAILSACPTKSMPNIDDIGKPPVQRTVQPPMMVPTAAALKMGVGFPLKNIPNCRGDRILSSHAKPTEPLQLNECGICRQRRDQHLLAKCDTCHLYYHMNCLNPPLSRLPKKSKLYGWQCSECDKSSESEVEEVKTPRRSRSVYSRDRTELEISPVAPKLKIKAVTAEEDVSFESSLQKAKKERRHSSVSDKTKQYEDIQIGGEENAMPDNSEEALTTNDLLVELTSNNDMDIVDTDHPENYEGHKSSKKRRREKHRNRYSPELGTSSKEHKRKRKKKSLEIEETLPHPRITIKIKSIPLPAGEVASESNPQCFYVRNEVDDNPPPPILLKLNDHPSTCRRISTDLKASKRNRSPRASFSDNSAKDPLAITLKDPLEIAPLTVRSNRSSVGRNSTLPTQVNPVGICNSNCDVCQQEGTAANSVKCDECQKLYHFSCLEPPLKSSPKKRGYSWHCADCDPTSSE
ncbi:hypothetical protein D910_11209 [Dendroctonus ponderosae]|uniref:PHD finger protein 14 n=1 Tax=Dendroctonus ponderosae TaxID=77166 RepID=U4UN85_DENPD|nr:hypothetical protein D910_11209 [Dendroctonus ponderosae]